MSSLQNPNLNEIGKGMNKSDVEGRPVKSTFEISSKQNFEIHDIPNGGQYAEDISLGKQQQDRNSNNISGLKNELSTDLVLKDQRKGKKSGRYKDKMDQKTIKTAISRNSEHLASLPQPKEPSKLTEMKGRKQELLSQLGKLQQQLQVLNAPKQNINPEDPQFRALELVKRMNQERKKREERVRIDTDKIKKVNAQRELENKLILQQIQRTRKLKRLEEEEKQKRKKTEKQKKLEERRLEVIHVFARSIVFEIVDSVLYPTNSADAAPEKQPIENFSSKTFKIRQHNLILQNKSLTETLPVQSKYKKYLPPVVVKLDGSNHLYPKNIFRQKILEQERKKKEIEKQLDDQKKKVVEMRRLHNLPAIRSRPNKSQMVEGDFKLQSKSYGKSMASKTIQTQENQSLVVQNEKTNNAEQIVQMQQETLHQNVELKEKQKEENLSKSEKDQNFEQEEDKNENDKKENIVRRKQSDQLSEEYEMQFFKSSHPDPNYKPDFVKINDSLKNQSKQEEVGNSQKTNQQLTEQEALFWQHFTDFGGEEENFFIKFANRIRKDNNLEELGKVSQKQKFVFDIDV